MIMDKIYKYLTVTKLDYEIVFSTVAEVEDPSQFVGNATEFKYFYSDDEPEIHNEDGRLYIKPKKDEE